MWVVGADKEIRLPLCVPNINPYLNENDNGGADLYFQFADKISHIDFCDRRGRSIYVSDLPIFDDSATPVAEGLRESASGYRIHAYQFNKDNYYFVVLTAKNGLLKFISLPVEVGIE